jgi:hypothetical protein
MLRDEAAVHPAVRGAVDERRTDVPTDGMRRGGFALLVVGIIMGAVLRVVPVTGSPFVPGDGGLFYEMTREMAARGGFPVTTAYDHAHLPFAYPPLGFLVVLGVHAVSGVSLLNLFTVVPLVYSIASVAAFGWLARTVLGRGYGWPIATCAFAALPDAFYGEVMGAGVTRALGQLLALLALPPLIHAYRTGSVRASLVGGVLAGLTILSHPDWALFLAVAAVLFWAFSAPRPESARLALLAAGVALVVSSPWWLRDLMQFGLPTLAAPLLNGSHDRPPYYGLANVLAIKFTDDSLFALGTAAALCGTVLCLVRRQYLLPCWLLLTLMVETRANTSRAVIVVALLAGVSGQVLLEAGGQRVARWTARALLAWFVLYLFAAGSIWESRNTGSISQADVRAMSWVRSNTSVDSNFVVMVAPGTSYIHPGEWFPALTGRRNLNAPGVGYEWVPGAPQAQEAANRAVMSCDHLTARCVQGWAATLGETFDYLYVADKPVRPGGGNAGTCCPSIIRSAERSSGYKRVYSHGGVQVFAHR